MNWIVRLTARALEPREREIVLGDLAECGSSGAGALFDVLDLVVRRQLLIWTSSPGFIVDSAGDRTP